MEQKTRIRGQENGRSLFCVGVWEELLEEVVFKHQPQGVRELPCCTLEKNITNWKALRQEHAPHV